MIEILQKHGASFRAANEYDCTPLHFAAGAGLNEVVKALVAKGALLEARDYVGDTPLFWAVNDGPPSEAGFDDTSYSFSVEQKGLVAKTLLMSGANVNARNQFGQSPMFVAIRSHPKLVQLLLEHEADIGVRTADNETALHAAAYESVDVVEVLLRAGCEVNVKGEGGDTPLHIAARRGDEAMLQLLLNHGAQRDVRNDSNQLPLDCCTTDACRRTLSEHMLAK